MRLISDAPLTNQHLVDKNSPFQRCLRTGVSITEKKWLGSIDSFGHLAAEDKWRVDKLGHSSILTCQMRHTYTTGLAKIHEMASTLPAYTVQPGKLSSSWETKFIGKLLGKWQKRETMPIQCSTAGKYSRLLFLFLSLCLCIAPGHWIDWKIHCRRDFLIIYWIKLKETSWGAFCSH